MKKFYILALTLISFATASAQSLKIYQNVDEDNDTYVEVTDGSVITVREVEKDGNAKYGYTFEFDPRLFIDGSQKGAITYTATRVGDFVNVGADDDTNYGYQVCPEGTECNDALSTGATTISESFNFPGYGKLSLGIHAITGSIKSSNVTEPIGYAKVDYEFYYTSNPTDKRTFTVIFDNDPSNAGVSNITVDDNNAKVEYFNLNGVSIDSGNLTSGLYIKRQGSKVSKVVIK